MLMPADIAKMPHDTPATTFTKLFTNLSWIGFEMFVVAEATRRTPPGLTQALAAADLRTDWTQALENYTDSCQLSIMTRTYRQGSQSKDTERARVCLGRARNRLNRLRHDLLPKPPHPHAPDHIWAIKQLAEQRAQELDGILATVSADPGYQKIEKLGSASNFRTWCLEHGFPYAPLDDEQQSLLDAPPSQLLAKAEAETSDFSQESVFAHPLFVQPWTAALAELSQHQRQRLGLDPTYEQLFLRETDMILDTSQPKPAIELRLLAYRQLAAIYRRQREAARVYADVRHDLNLWRFNNTRSTYRVAADILASRYPEEVEKWRAQWTNSPPPPPPTDQQRPKTIPHKAEVFAAAAAASGWELTTYLPTGNPHPMYPDSIVYEATRPDAIHPAFFVRFQSRRGNRTSIAVFPRIRVRAIPWVDLQNLSTVLVLLPMTDEQIFREVRQRHRLLSQATAHRQAAKAAGSVTPET